MHPRGLPAFLALLLLTTGLTGTAEAQCILANPSFEVGASGSQVFGGWNQFGNVGSTSFASHGSVAARVTGPDAGGWDVSGYWQELECSPGERWDVTGHVAHASSNPLTGDCRAIVNIEWWDAGGMIDYESHEVALPSTQTDLYQSFEFTSTAAPSGTESIHALFAVLQSPTDPPPEVIYDQVTVFSTSYPTIYDQQWNDFPGGRSISFAGYTWRVKGPGYYGPGPNLFSNSLNHVWVDDEQLHMTVKYDAGNWYSTEVALIDTLGYGDYIFTTEGRLDLLDPAVVLGMFIWQYGPCYDDSYLWWNPYNEFDIEFSRWGNPSDDIGQFVAQPWDWYGNIERFDATFSEDEITSHAFRWLPDRVECRSWRGGPYDESPATMIHEWTYTGPHIPRPEIPRVHVNLWRCCDDPSSDQEVVLDTFTFVPVGWTGIDDPAAGWEHGASPGRLLTATPNPFNPMTTIGYSLRESGPAEIAVYSIGGRKVRSLIDGFVPAGRHEVTWDGTDSRGRPVASGVYFYELRVGDSRETKRVVLLK